MSTTRNPAVALDYSGGAETTGSILMIDFELGSRGAAIQWLSQYPHEEELLFPPCTGLSVVDVAQIGAKRCLLVSVNVSTARPNTSEVLTPQYIPGTAAAMSWVGKGLRLKPGSSLADVTLLDLSSRNCHGTGASALGLLLGRAGSSLPALRQLIARGAQLNDQDAAHIAAGLAINLHLLSLDLSANKLTPAGVVRLARGLASSAVRSLAIYNNDVGAAGAEALAAVVANGGTLSELTLHSCPLPCQALLGSDGTKTIDLCSKGLTTLDGCFVGALLPGNRALRVLNLSDNRLGAGVESITRALAQNEALQRLSLEHNNLSKASKTQLKAIAGRRSRPLELHL